MRSTTFLWSLYLVLPFVYADPHAQQGRRHQDVSKRLEGSLDLHKRFSNAKFTYYGAGMGACGQESSSSDFVVALNSAQYGNGADCFKTITILCNGKTAQAKIVDECPGCGFGDLDLTTALFQHFAPEIEGVIYGTWTFDGLDNSDAKTSSSKKHTSTHTTHTTHTSHSTHTVHSSTAQTSTSTSSISSSTSINYLSGAASGLAVPTGTIEDSTNAVNNLNDFNQAIIQLGAIIVAGGSSK